MMVRYWQWRRETSDAVLFLLVCCEVLVFLFAWAVGCALVVMFVAAPLFFGGWGFGIWLAAFVLVIAACAVGDRQRLTKGTGNV